MTRRFEGLVGIPFLWGGRSKSGFDCYGLVMECFGRVGVEIPDYGHSTDFSTIDSMIKTFSSLWQKTELPGSPCVAAFRIRPGLVTHVGFVLPDNRSFIHVMENTLVTIEKLSAPCWAKRLEGFYLWTGG